MKKMIILLLCTVSTHQSVGVLDRKMISRIQKYEQQKAAGVTVDQPHSTEPQSLNRETHKKELEAQARAQTNKNYALCIAGGILAYAAYAIHS